VTRAAIVVATLALAAGRAHAQDATNDTVVHRVRAGDSLELLAAELYGDRTKAVFIVAENRLARARPLRPGERLRLPVGREVTTAPGDTFKSVAAAMLGSAQRATFLAELNNMAPEDGLPAGTPLTIPFTITHTATAPEALSDVARMYFGDSRNAELLRRYNFLDRTTLDKGESLIVPAYQVRTSAARTPALDAESKARREHRREVSARAARALPAARQAWRDGDFAGVKAQLAPLAAELDYLDRGDAVDAGVLLGAALVAYDDTEPALAAFKQVIARQQHATLRRYDYSPKILAIWQKAGGQIE